MRIDSHQHFWTFDPIRNSWITDEMSVIQRDFNPADLQAELDANNIDGCVSIQADQSETETHFLLEHASQHDFIKGVVGWIDFRSPNFQERLEYFKPYKKLKGFRHIVQAEPDNNFLLGKDFCRGISLLMEHNYTYDILIYPKQLLAAIKFVDKFPNQLFVVDHLAKPFIKNGNLKGWEKEIRALASFENVYCKISGMVTEADWKNWKEENFKPYLDVVFNAFGTTRIMYGSDWPVCLLAASYKSQLGIVENYLASFSKDEQADVLGLNAQRFYSL